MKKLLTPFVLLFLVFTALESNAQARAGLGLVYGTGVEEAGINLNGEYGITDQISANANISIFFIEDVGEFERGYWTLNLDGHYYFQGGLTGPYALAGLNVSTITFDTPVNDGSSSEVGLNLGAGYLYDTGTDIVPFGDLKFILGDADQLVFRLGAKYNF